jgi:hypothetical protein
MATEVFINIKDLPEITEIANGQFILVETNTGTHIIDFKNLLLPSDNTLITATVNQNINAITTLTTSVDTLSTTTFATIDSLSSSINSNLNTLSSTVSSITTNFSKGIYNFVTKSQISIPANNSSASNIVSPFNATAATLTTNDFIVIPTNIYAAKYPVYVSNYDETNGNVTITGIFSRNQIAFNPNNSGNLIPSQTLSGLTFTQVIDCLKIEETTAAATEVATYVVVGIRNV